MVKDKTSKTKELSTSQVQDELTNKDDPWLQKVKDGENEKKDDSENPGDDKLVDSENTIE